MPIPNGVVWFDDPEPPRTAGRLSRERIVEAAIELADADARGEVTMRAIAAKLGSSTPMSLYRYVGSKDGLTDLMLDRVNGEIAVPAEGSWQERLRGLALSARAAVRRHPWYARLTFSRPPFGPNALAIFDAGLAALEPLGLDAATRMGFVSAVLGHVYATGLAELEESTMRDRIGLATDTELNAVAEPYHQRITEEGRYPHYIRWVNDPERFGPGPTFEQTLDWLLAGLSSVAAR
jgi:AcrR family transcriptional regulator